MRLRTFAESYGGDFYLATIILVGVAMVSAILALFRSLRFVQLVAPYIEWVVYVTGLAIIGLFNFDFVLKLVMSVVRSKAAPARRVPERTGLGGYYDKRIRERAELW